MPPAKVHLTQEKATMLITLYGRALQNRMPTPVLQDPWAERVIEQIDYDFAKFKVGMRSALLVALRARQLDLWTSEFLAQHAEATVLHLGCGLDSRVERLDPAPRVRWFDVDYPAVIELRQQVYPSRPGYQMIGASLADLGWLAEVPACHPTLVVAEGVTMYLNEAVIKSLLNSVVDRFPAGRFAFDVHTPRLVQWLSKSGANVRGTGATFAWGIDDPNTIRQLEPRLTLLAERCAHELAAFARLPWQIRALVRVMDATRVLRVMRCLLYNF